MISSSFLQGVCVCVFCLTLIFGDASALGHQRTDLFVFCIGTINFWTMNMELYSCRVQLSRYKQINTNTNTNTNAYTCTFTNKYTYIVNCIMMMLFFFLFQVRILSSNHRILETTRLRRAQGAEGVELVVL